MTVENSLFLDTTFPVQSVDSFAGHWYYDHNAFFPDGDTYSVPLAPPTGVGDVTSDPLLDSSTAPPTPGVGSPLKGAGNPAVLPVEDYFGQPWTSPDIGAVKAR